MDSGFCTTEWNSEWNCYVVQKPGTTEASSVGIRNTRLWLGLETGHDKRMLTSWKLATTEGERQEARCR